MGAAWLVVLLIYGTCAGFDRIETLFWLMLIPLLLEDNYTVNKEKRR